MRKSLFEYSKDKKGMKSMTKKEDSNFEKKEKKGKSGFEKSGMDEEQVKRKVEEYSKLSESELFKELHKEMDKQKATGNFNFNQLESQLDNIKPMLNDSQKNNLENILKNLKK